MNSYLGDTLKMEFDFKFDAVVGNPPRNSSEARNSLWIDFVKKALIDNNEWLLPNGYLCFVHSSGWRKPCANNSQFSGLFQLMAKDNTIEKLFMRGIKNRKRTVNWGTRFDYYLLKKHVSELSFTEVNDENYETHFVNMNEWQWLPNCNIADMKSLLGCMNDQKVTVLSDSSYHAIRSYVSSTKDGTFIYPLIHSTAKNGITFQYSATNKKRHFGIPKVIFGESGINDVVIDMDGTYGMTQSAIAILVSDIEHAQRLKKALLSNKFKMLVSNTCWGNFRIEKELFSYLKYDFYTVFH